MVIFWIHPLWGPPLWPNGGEPYKPLASQACFYSCTGHVSEEGSDMASNQKGPTMSACNHHFLGAFLSHQSKTQHACKSSLLNVFKMPT